MHTMRKIFFAMLFFSTLLARDCCAMFFSSVSRCCSGPVRYVLGSFGSRAQRVLWCLAVRNHHNTDSADIANLKSFLSDSTANAGVDPNFLMTMWDGTTSGVQYCKHVSPLAAATLLGNPAIVKTMLGFSRVDVNCPCYTLSQDEVAEKMPVSSIPIRKQSLPFDLALRGIIKAKARIDVVSASGGDPGANGGHPDGDLSEQLYRQKEVGRMLCAAGAKSRLFVDVSARNKLLM